MTNQGVNNTDLVNLAAAFRARLSRRKEALKSPHWQWYPYETLTNVLHLRDLLNSARLELNDLVRGQLVADIGCGDGDLSFFLEQVLHCRVDALDNPVTHHNGMEGVRALCSELKSTVQVTDADLDTQWHLPRDGYAMVFLLGVLYHLKNPIYTLEAISKRSRHIILSTRIARRFPGVAQDLDGVPAAYLVAKDELNADNSNYWIFTEAGLRRTLERANWHVVAMVRKGDTQSSDPVHDNHDERAFCLAESRYALANVELLRGWHGVEGAGWRWTEGRFAVRVKRGTSPLRTLLLQGFVPRQLLAEKGSVTLQLRINGLDLPPQTLSADGDFSLRLALPSTFAQAAQLEIEGRVEPYLPPQPSDPRERGIIVAALAMET